MSARGKPYGRRFVEEVNKGKAAMLAAIDQIYDTNIVIHGLGEDINGIENWKQFWSDLFDAFPDYQATFDDRIVKGDKVVTRYTGTGTHKDTNKKWTHWGISLFRRTGGARAQEHWRCTWHRKLQTIHQRDVQCCS